MSTTDVCVDNREIASFVVFELQYCSCSRSQNRWFAENSIWVHVYEFVVAEAI